MNNNYYSGTSLSAVKVSSLNNYKCPDHRGIVCTVVVRLQKYPLIIIIKGCSYSTVVSCMISEELLYSVLSIFN